MNVREGAATSVDITGGGEDALIVRPGAEVEARGLPDGGFEFIASLLRGETVLAAAQAAITASPFRHRGHLSGLLEAGAIIGFCGGETKSTFLG